MDSELDRDEFISEKWNSLDALSHARQLLHDFFHLIDKSRPAAMMIRHSIRYKIKSATEIKSANLKNKVIFRNNLWTCVITPPLVQKTKISTPYTAVSK